ncbi:hypothetical protein BpHYR1_044545 [Brachionus plicatilis]|uniref:SWIM-type domain-containing protein n=1 Tax=Brachionus plicatilis TaxID=10195 RepID=A0A3M7R1D8_BRAPC|nr:hypothetical protein BpHYR1_044545 [Brachionus plicatilis]
MDCSCRWYIKNNICKRLIDISKILNIPGCELPLSAKNIPIVEKRKPGRPAKAKQALIVHRNLGPFLLIQLILLYQVLTTNFQSLAQSINQNPLSKENDIDQYQAEIILKSGTKELSNNQNKSNFIFIQIREREKDKITSDATDRRELDEDEVGEDALLALEPYSSLRKLANPELVQSSYRVSNWLGAMSLHRLTPGWMAPRPRSILTCSTLHTTGTMSSRFSLV